MIPTVNSILDNELIIKSQPSKTFKMYIIQEYINGYTDELEAMMQAIYMILNTERYQYVIYSWDYGIELIDLYGEPVTYVCSELERRIKEALSQDDRILSIDSFSFDNSIKRKVQVSFTVHTIFGDINTEKVVNY